jgi:hypothetical protein
VQQLKGLVWHGNIVCQVNEGVGDEEEVPALPYVLALHAFCVVDPTLCVPATDQSQFVVTLQPYLKNQVKFIFLLPFLFTFAVATMMNWIHVLRSLFPG